MHPAPTTPLGQAFAAIIALLIAAIAEHAREHPMLAGGCRASIRQLEKLARRFDAMVAEWQATQAESRRPGAAPKPAFRIAPKRRRDDLSRRRAVAMWKRLPAARAPPPPCRPAIRAASARAPPTSGLRQAR